MTAQGILTILGRDLEPGDRLRHPDGTDRVVVTVHRDPSPAVIVRYTTRSEHDGTIAHHAAGLDARLHALPGRGDPDPLVAVAIDLYASAPNLTLTRHDDARYGARLTIHDDDGTLVGHAYATGRAGVRFDLHSHLRIPS